MLRFIFAKIIMINGAQMYLGEPELQAKRRTLSILMDESRKVVDTVRNLSLYYSSLLKGDNEGAGRYQQAVYGMLEEVQGFRRALTRQLAEMGGMLLNREDLLRTAYALEELASYMESISFRLGQVDIDSLFKADLTGDIEELLSLLIESINKTNETIRALQLNPERVNDLVSMVEKIERDFDIKYRGTIVKAIERVNNFKDLILIKDVLERLETVSDLSLKVADTVLIISIGF